MTPLRVQNKSRLNRRAQPPTFCMVPRCGRTSYARGLCQTHHRQLRTTGQIKPIRPYRPRSEHTVRFGGLRVTLGCARALTEHARQNRLSQSAAIASVLERWMTAGSPTPRRGNPEA